MLHENQINNISFETVLSSNINVNSKKDNQNKDKIEINS